MTLQDVLTYLEERLKELRADDDWCPECKGIGRRYYWLDGEFAERICPDCNGAGKSPAITQAEAALEAVRGAVDREEKLLAWASEAWDVIGSDDPHSQAYERSECGAEALAILNPVTKPVTNSIDETVTGTDSSDCPVTNGEPGAKP